MKFTLVLTTLVLCATLINAQTEPTKSAIRMSAGEDSYHAKLRLTTSIMDARYCVDGRISYSLRFKFTNVGAQTVILDRFRPVVSRYMVSRNERASSARQYEADARILIGLDEGAVSLNAVLNESHFVPLKGGESYEIQERFSFSINDKNGRSLRSGTHMLQVIVLTWPHARESNLEWREKLQHIGYLWSDSIRSEPMPFVIAERPSFSECQ